MILDPHLDQRQSLVTSRGSPVAHAYHVWSKYRQTARMT